LSEATGRKVDLTNPAVNGFTTLDLIDRELRYVRGFKPQIVSVLIGVNDLVQGRTTEQYQAALRRIYDAVGSLKLPAGRPSRSPSPTGRLVPAARDFGDPARLRRPYRTPSTAIAQEEAAGHGFTWIDITHVSTSRLSRRLDLSRPPASGDVQYAAWADRRLAGGKGQMVGAG